jgi:preprotein translocase subunit SecD
VLQATLTLPGIAGVVLTIGMAVDANVLIFERIREEVAIGRTPISAVDAGYSRAITTIIDANVTTLIAAVLLYQFGSGPIRGFAVTLAIGIVTSMFTAIMITRLMVVTWLRRTKPEKLEI